MPAPAGFKTFVAGAVLSATSDVQGYLMDQVCTVWNDAAARTSGLGSPAEGQLSYLKDTDQLYTYDGAAWQALPTGDVTGVTAGTNIDVTDPGGPTPTVDLAIDAEVACADQVVSRAQMKDYAETVNALGSKSAAFNIDFEDGNVQTVTITSGTFNIGLTNSLASHSNSVTILGTNLGAGTPSFVAGAHGGGGNAVVWAGGTAPTYTASGTDVLCFTTFDGGTTFYGFAAGLDFS
jgi:hypothetical protein